MKTSYRMTKEEREKEYATIIRLKRKIEKALGEALGGEPFIYGQLALKDVMRDNCILNHGKTIEKVVFTPEQEALLRGEKVETNQNENVLASTFGEEKRWVNWEPGTKVPKTITGRNALPNDPATWSNYLEVKKVSDNVGIMFKPDQLLLGVDIDHCLENDVIVHEQKEIIEWFIKKANTYTEISPSNTGLHLFLSLTAPLSLIAKRHAPFEAYTSGRYFTVTNNPYGEARLVRTVDPEEAVALLVIIGYPWKK
mgnify:CR=1 FL=1